jgi:DNA-binding SARP family transcriptional activator
VAEFRLLGPVEVEHAGRLVDIGSARQQSVLATLLLDANRPVSTDQIVDRVWGDQRLPDRPRNAVQTYVSLLRRSLAGIAQVTLVRQPGGYALRLDQRLVDVHVFRRLIDEARATADNDRAPALIERALRMWRGEPFGTLDAPWLVSVRAVLNEERLAAQRELTDAQLRNGRHNVLLPQLSGQVEANPLDERLAGQLMLALFRSGRQADALRHYQRVRRQLADELGADPGRALQRMHRQILTDDSELST